jgi:hypothetical protein
MKLNLFETHDRFEDFTKKTSKQALTIGECVQDIVNQKPFGNHPFYIYAHTRTLDLRERYELFQTGKYKTFEHVPSKRLIHQPRLTKPKAQTNSMLFKAYPGTDKIRIIWIIPAREMWKQYKKGNVTQSETIAWSIQQFQHNRNELEQKEPDDLTDEQIDAIYQSLGQQARYDKRMAKIYLGE